MVARSSQAAKAFSGTGYLLATELAKRGYRAFAGVRRHSSMKAGLVLGMELFETDVGSARVIKAF